jgi:ornithine cyclodeaminase
MMKIIEKDEVFQQLDMKTCIGLMREALTLLEEGKAFQPVRSICKFPQGEAFGFMPAYMGVDDCFGAKVLSAFPQNAGTEYPSHIGYVMIFESQHGTCKGLADAGAITQIRTGAVSAVATDLLARKDATSLGIIGAGAQARSHLEAILQVRPQIETIKVYSLHRSSTERYKKEMEEKFHKTITICESVRDAVADCDIVCTLTPSKEAYLTRDMIKDGAHVNAVGTFSPVTREAASDLISASGLYADQVEAMKKESGEYLVPLSEGLITEEHIRGSIGEVLLGKAAGRQNEKEITLFDALGLAVEDIICGRYLLM